MVNSLLHFKGGYSSREWLERHLWKGGICQEWQAGTTFVRNVGKSLPPGLSVCSNYFLYIECFISLQKSWYKDPKIEIILEYSRNRMKVSVTGAQRETRCDTHQFPFLLLFWAHREHALLGSLAFRDIWLLCPLKCKDRWCTFFPKEALESYSWFAIFSSPIGVNVRGLCSNGSNGSFIKWRMMSGYHSSQKETKGTKINFSCVKPLKWWSCLLKHYSLIL